MLVPRSYLQDRARLLLVAKHMTSTVLKPVTREEALQYDAGALLTDTEKRKNNIGIFEGTILKEKEAIDQNKYMISKIDPNHPDVKKLEENIKKMKTNIKTFEDAIVRENEEIERDIAMIKIIESN